MAEGTAYRTGQQAEQCAEQFLVEIKGYRLLARNYRCAQGEIDRIFIDGCTLVFLEVRYRTHGQETALESISPQKMRRLIKTAYHYIAHHPTALSCRFDVVCISGKPGQPGLSISHLEEAFTLNDL